VSPQPACRESGRRQGVVRGGRAGTRQGRRRICLLKGCARPFEPRSRAQKYCSHSCRQAADRWRLRKAAWEYRHSAQGKEKRAAQCKRRRQRQKRSEPAARSPPAAARSPPAAASEGHQLFVGDGDFCCNRPGCYQLFDRSARSPLQRFCTSSCCQAMRRVRVREARWRGRGDPRHPPGGSRRCGVPRRGCRL
jgi:hypothetical protein